MALLEHPTARLLPPNMFRTLDIHASEAEPEREMDYLDNISASFSPMSHGIVGSGYAVQGTRSAGGTAPLHKGNSLAKLGKWQAAIE